MAPPIYFFPKLRPAELAPGGLLDHALLARYGLERTFADVRRIETDAALFELVGLGPGEQPGSLFCALPSSGDAPPRVQYAPKSQRWQQYSCGGDPFWVGVDADWPPTAEDLVRRRTFGGYHLDLGGRRWLVPIVRTPLGGFGSLPCRWEYDAGGRVVERLRAEYVELWERFAAVVDMFRAGGRIEMDRTEAAELCVAALALNYRVGRVEQNMLGLVDNETWLGILAAAIDYLAYRDLFRGEGAEKKTESPTCGPPDGAAISDGSTPTSPGSADICPDTGPAGSS